jgi:16S rRNA processing protein RimM
MAKCEYLECGRVQNTHGCHGWIKVESFCDSPKILASLGQVYRRVSGQYVPVKVLETGRKQDTVLMHLEGIDDMDVAERMKNEVLYAARADIPLEDGAYFLYVRGGKNSKYPKEDIKRISKAAAEKIL